MGADAEEAADIDDHAVDLAGLVEHDLADLADGVAAGVLHVEADQLTGVDRPVAVLDRGSDPQPERSGTGTGARIDLAAVGEDLAATGGVGIGVAGCALRRILGQGGRDRAVRILLQIGPGNGDQLLALQPGADIDDDGIDLAVMADDDTVDFTDRVARAVDDVFSDQGARIDFAELGLGCGGCVLGKDDSRHRRCDQCSGDARLENVVHDLLLWQW